jgi:ABC-type sugar transport system ATPase subunit
MTSAVRGAEPSGSAPRGGGAVVALRGITKTYPGVTALSSVDLAIHPGTVNALVGENGAGKSTLAKIMSGQEQPDAGEILIDGSAVTLDSPATARRYGVNAVPQELSLVRHLSVAENVCLTDLPSRRGVLDKRALRRRAEGVLESLGLTIDPFSTLGDHGPGTQSLVMIGRGLVHEARVLILDEPTAALSKPEVDRLFEVVRLAQERGTAFIYISHRMDELKVVADTITVLRDGVRVLTEPMDEFDEDEIVRAMVGREVARFVGTRAARAVAAADVSAADRHAPRLLVEGLTRNGVFEDVSFSVGRGEILGIAGLMGAGRTEVARAIYGMDPYDSGTISVDGQERPIRSPRDANRAGIVMTPEERKSQGLVLDMSVERNLTAARISHFARFGWLRPGEAKAQAGAAVERLGIKTPNLDAPVRTLSGGNQQKVVIGRWLVPMASVYLFDEPTRGVDVNAKVEVYEILDELASAGAGIVVISSELIELLAISDRILVMREGAVVSELSAEEATEEQVVAASMGQRREAQ